LESADPLIPVGVAAKQFRFRSGQQPRLRLFYQTYAIRGYDYVSTKDQGRRRERKWLQFFSTGTDAKRQARKIELTPFLSRTPSAKRVKLN
jgi:hypothetical protein